MVIAIISILMSLMFPVFAKAIRKARSLGHENPKNPNGPRIAPSSVHPKEWEKDRRFQNMAEVACWWGDHFLLSLHFGLLSSFSFTLTRPLAVRARRV